MKKENKSLNKLKARLPLIVFLSLLHIACISLNQIYMQQIINSIK